MSEKLRLLDLFEGKKYQKIILAICVLAFLALELFIYLGAASQAGQKSRVIITDLEGNVKYESPGTALTSYEKMVFEDTFGPLENYRIHIQTRSQPFPFRAWVSAAIGIPVGIVLLVAFIIKVYLTLLYGEEKTSKDSPDPSDNATRFGSLLTLFKGFSVFYIGFFLVIGVLLLWMVPNFLGDFAHLSFTTIKEFKWFFLGLSIFLGLLITWIIYLRYKLSKKILENQLDLEKYRLDKQLLIQGENPALLPGSMNEAQDR